MKFIREERIIPNTPNMPSVVRFLRDTTFFTTSSLSVVRFTPYM